MEKQKIITCCGSSKFVDIMAVCSWLLERDEKAIVMGLHLLPTWYPNCPDYHLAEYEGVADEMDLLHMRKIDISDEIFVVNFEYYIGKSTNNEVIYAGKSGKKIRWFTHDPVGVKVMEMIENMNLKDCSL